MAKLDPFGGEETFNADPARVFAFLTNIEEMSKTIPDLVSAEKIDDRTLKAVVKPGFTFLRSTMRLTIRMEPDEANRTAVMKVQAEGLGVGMNTESTMRITPDANGARVQWTASVTDMRGLISLAPTSLVRGAAEKTVKDGFDALRKKLET
ncbi:MAG: SRPBCC family protein [Phycisphaeraceae bacterium]|nr:SRPBCC family protein [Phycisphaeraceae bacterium]